MTAPARWDRPFHAAPAGATHLFRQALERIPIDLQVRILEIGSGAGALAIEIAQARPLAEIVGIDISRENLRLAQAAARVAGTDDKLQFVCADFASFRDSPFDLILVQGCLCWIHCSDSKLADNLRRHIKATGIILAVEAISCPSNRVRIGLRRLLQCIPARLSDGIILSVARRLYPDWPKEVLHDRLIYLRRTPLRLDGPSWRRSLTASRLRVCTESAWPSTSIAKLRYRLAVIQPID